ncbi:hydrogenase maturation protease, partial [Chloroflexota bacterium]
MDAELARTLKKELYGWRRVVILGLGNELGGDDQSGLLAVREIKQVLPGDITGVDIFETGIAPENYTGVLRNLLPSHVIIIDSAQIGERAGYTTIINSESIQELIPSTHSLPLSTLA